MSCSSDQGTINSGCFFICCIGETIAISLKTGRSSTNRKSKPTINIVAEDSKEAAASVGLRYVSDESSGITRRRKGASFAYYDKEGKRIRDSLELKRIHSLAIPPAWEKVWICARANGHLRQPESMRRVGSSINTIHFGEQSVTKPNLKGCFHSLRSCQKSEHRLMRTCAGRI